MSDPIDEALKATAHAEASAGFSTQVRARIAAGDEDHGAWWPRVAAACAAVALVATLVMARSCRRRNDGAVAASTSAGPTRRGTSSGAGASAGTGHRSAGRRRHLGCQSGAPLSRVSTTRSTTSDHDRALAPLSPLDGLSLSSLAPAAMVVGDRASDPAGADCADSRRRDAVGDDDEENCDAKDLLDAVARGRDDVGGGRRRLGRSEAATSATASAGRWHSGRHKQESATATAGRADAGRPPPQGRPQREGRGDVQRATLRTALRRRRR